MEPSTAAERAPALPEPGHDALRVLFVSRVFAPGSRHGGSLTDQLVLARELVARGHRVRVVASDVYHPGVRYPPEARSERHGGMTVQRLPSRLAYHWDAVSAGAARALRLAAAEASVVQVFGVRHHLEHVAFRVAGPVPVLSMPQGGLPARGRSLALKRAIDAVLERRILRSAAAVVATSEKEHADLLEWGVPAGRLHRLPEFGEALPPPVSARDEVRRGLGVRPDATLLAWSGRVHAIKGLDLLLEVLAGDGDLSAVCAVLIGEDEGDGERERLERLASRLGISARVRFAGWCDGQRRSDLYAASDAFVLPSLVESFSRSAAEAIMLGLPLVAADTCGIVEHAPEASLVFPRSAPGLAEALRSFGARPGLRHALRAGALRAAPALHPRRAGAFLERLYGECSRRPSRPRPRRRPAAARSAPPSAGSGVGTDARSGTGRGSA